MKDKLKIALIVCVFPPYKGGIGTAVESYAEHLSGLGHDVTVFTPRYHDMHKADEANHYKIERLPALIKFGNAAIMNQIGKKLQGFDIIDLSLPLGTGEVVLFLKKIGKIKAPIVAHYHMDLMGKNLVFKSLFAIWQNFFIPAELKISKKVIVSSRDYLQNSKIFSFAEKHREKFLAMPYGVDTDKFYETKRNRQLETKLELKDKKVILFVGGLDEAHYFKGVNYLLEAFAKVKNDKYYLIIVGKGNLKPQYEAQAKQLKISNRVYFAGFISDRDLPKYYNLCDVFVLPSINAAEAFGIVLAEAMACGKPTIASNLPGVREVFGKDQKIISIRPKDATDLAKKIKNVLEDKELYNSISKKNVARVKKEFSSKVIAQKLTKIYQEVVNDL